MFRILVAEDDESTRLLHVRGAAARQAMSPVPPETVWRPWRLWIISSATWAIVDITMPRMDGIAFTQTLREGNCDLPVLMVTARVTQEDKRRGFRAGTRMTIWSSLWTRRRCSGVWRRCCGAIAVQRSGG